MYEINFTQFDSKYTCSRIHIQGFSCPAMNCEYRSSMPNHCRKDWAWMDFFLLVSQYSKADICTILYKTNKQKKKKTKVLSTMGHIA